MKNVILPEKWVVYVHTCKWNFWKKYSIGKLNSILDIEEKELQD